MNLDKSIRKTFFSLTVKSPITVLVIIVLMITSLLYISFTNYSSVYVKIKTNLQRGVNPNDSPYVKVKVSKNYASSISTHTSVIWYSTNDKRYKGVINKIDSSTDKENLDIAISLSKYDVDIENPKELTVELMVKKLPIIEKLTMGVEDQ